MKHFTLLRSYLEDRTIGKLDELRTLERPWKGNAVDISCIPEGDYIVVRDHYGRHQYYSITDVEGRTFIEMHGGVFPTHSNGCVLVGMRFDSSHNLVGYTEGLVKLLKKFGEDKVLLTIRKYDPELDGEF